MNERNENQTPYGYNPNMGQSMQGYDPNAGQPMQGYNPNAGQPVQGYNPNAGQPMQGYNPNAGQWTNGYNQNPVGGAAMPPKKKKKAGAIIGIVIGVLVLIAAGVFGAFVVMEKMNEKASREVVDNFFKGYNDMDFDATYDTFHPQIRQTVKDGALAINGVENGSQFFELYDNYLGGMQVDYKIVNEKKVTDDELDRILSNMRVAYGVDLNVKKAYAYKVEERYYGSYNEINQTEVIVIGYDDGKWYVVYAETE
ncbi:MAG: hypothetical protein NC428_08640 [Clostridium sp.]|nr:hypothetical protein [Clostridium sp.]